jgi:endonuclease YncB( thermonuclease family)
LSGKTETNYDDNQDFEACHCTANSSDCVYSVCRLFIDCNHTTQIDQYLDQQSSGQLLTGKPARILDGDTLDLLSNSQIFRIRLKGIDAPEKTQAFGLEAKAYLTQLVSNQDLNITWSSKDKYDRIIGKIEIARTKTQ